MKVKKEHLNIILAVIFAILVIQIVVSFSGFAYLFKELWHSIYYTYRQLGGYSGGDFYDYHETTTNRTRLHYRLFAKFYRATLILFALLLVLIVVYCILKMLKLNKTAHKIIDIVCVVLIDGLSVASLIVVCSSVKYANGIVSYETNEGIYSYSFTTNRFLNSCYPLFYSIYDGFLTQTISIVVPAFLLAITIVIKFCFNIYFCHKEKKIDETVKSINQK